MCASQAASASAKRSCSTIWNGIANSSAPRVTGSSDAITSGALSSSSSGAAVRCWNAPLRQTV